MFPQIFILISIEIGGEGDKATNANSIELPIRFTEEGQ